MKEVVNFLVLVFLALFLMIMCGCSTELSKQMTSTVKDDLTVLSLDLKECNETFEPRIKSISERVQLISDACESEKSMLKSQVRNRGLCIIFLVLIICVGVVLIIRKK